ncbi:MAG: 5'-methylthioadenosine/S-adenosylhomocysteine nucleosidase [Clostridia bacterium]|nr:5'-methylthioadenosine/S-adenosylhomocysteine nucleosidase [Clostridia bacterium]
MIGIIGATDFEMEILLRDMETEKKTAIGGFEFRTGSLFGEKITAVKCGIGKVFMAACCQTMLLNFPVERIINIGAAGALTGGLRPGDAVLADGAVQYDMDTTAFGDPLGMISGIGKVMFDCDICRGFGEALGRAGIHHIVGHNATADRFCADTAVKDMLVSHFGCVSVDMEAGALAQVCYINSKPFESIKIISDRADDTSGDDYNEYTGTVGERVMEILKIRFSV